MIPWRLQFTGIRDYPPTSLNITGIDEHVLITGPNGSGKSTITFCMGAVLYSAKVDVEGLISKNLPADKRWSARISFLFKNAGLMKIDAPDYIEFSLKIIQDPGQPMKKEFSIATRDNIDEWKETIKYTSGDRYYNFSAYKKDLQYKYKVDPDLYYLIWYQQEVNQFAVMHPEERFRIFSEMYGIDRVQKDWEGSMEKVKETEETVRHAENNVKYMGMELSIKKTALDRFLANQKRLYNGGKLYIQSLLQLEYFYQKEIEKLKEWIEQLEEQIGDMRDDYILKKGMKNSSEETLEKLQSKEKQLAEDNEKEKQVLQKTEEKIEQLQVKIDTLNDELKSISSRKNQIRRTEEEVKSGLEKLAQEKEKTEAEFKQLETLLLQIKNAEKEKLHKVAELKLQIKQDTQLEIEHRERLACYKSSHAVQETIETLDLRINKNKDKDYQLKRQQADLKEEWGLLKEERDLSARQAESMKYFRLLQIKAYPLRELIELDEGAKPKEEQLFDAIKYTIFFDGTTVIPPNDLYHVPLMSLRPDRMIHAIPHLKLKVKEGILEEEMPHALKALWWVEQFFNEGAFTIKNGVLCDPNGFRGPQEKERYILSARALKARKEEVEQLLSQLHLNQIQIEAEIEKDTKSLQELNSIIHQVKQSEAFMTAEHERVERKRRLEEEQSAHLQLEKEIDSLEENRTDLVKIQVKQQHMEQILREEEAVYIELGKMKGKYAERKQLQMQVEEEKAFVERQKRKIEQIDNELYEMGQQIRQTERGIENIESNLEDIERKIERLKIDKKGQVEDQETAQLELIQVIKELTDVEKLISEIYSEAVMDVSMEGLLSSSQLKKNREEGKVEFDYARIEKDIDQAAPENYEAVKIEYERLDSEYKRATILLEQDKERMETLKDQLETTINMRVLELQRRFKLYMSQFQFEGDINWETYEDKKKRTHFSLFIKARKEGHRGKMEDVSTKARGGKVGKGVSGGEESLSSLLFALALLQNLQTTPGFIVLDEFDSALDEERKEKVFDLYEQELKRKLIIVTPKSHEENYLNRFSKAFVVQHDPTIPQSKVVGIVKK